MEQEQHRLDIRVPYEHHPMLDNPVIENPLDPKDPHEMKTFVPIVPESELPNIMTTCMDYHLEVLNRCDYSLGWIQHEQSAWNHRNTPKPYCW